MGYRLEVSKLEHKFCGGKLYGYANKKTKDMKSYKYLIKNGYLDKNKYNENNLTFDMVYDDPAIVMSKRSFDDFINLYNEDMNEAQKEDNWIYNDEKDWVINNCKKLMTDLEDSDFVILEWY